MILEVKDYELKERVTVKLKADANFFVSLFSGLLEASF